MSLIMRRVYERLYKRCWFCCRAEVGCLALHRSERSDGNSKAGLYSKEEEKALTHAIFTSSSKSQSVFGQFFYLFFFLPLTSNFAGNAGVSVVVVQTTAATG